MRAGVTVERGLWWGLAGVAAVVAAFTWYVLVAIEGQLVAARNGGLMPFLLFLVVLVAEWVAAGRVALRVRPEVRCLRWTALLLLGSAVVNVVLLVGVGPLFVIG